jgi:tetratricopeptide (TPR) repeat protein
MVSEIVIIWPSNGSQETVGRIKARFAEILHELWRAELSPKTLDSMFSVVRIADPETLEVAGMVDMIRNAKPNTAFVIGRAANYLADDVRTPNRDGLMPEDTWVPHLHSFLRQAAAASVASKSYVMLDAGEHWPARPENRDLLMSVEGCAVAAGDDETSAINELVTKFGHWRQLAASGDLGTALAEMEALDSLSPTAKRLTRLRLLIVAGFPNETRTALESDPSLIADLAPDAALQVAALAEEADANDIASGLLLGALPELKSHEQLASALSLADRLGKDSLIQLAESSLSTRFPNSRYLRRYRAEAMVRDRHYSEASALLREDRFGEFVEAAEFYELLATHLQGSKPDPSALLPAVADRFPALIDEAKRACALSLENEGRRGEALDLLTTIRVDGERLNREMALAALASIHRGLMIRDPAVDKDTIARVIERVIESLSLRSRDAVTRVRLLRILSPEVLGISGTAIMAAVLHSLASRPVRIRVGQPADVRSGPSSDDELTRLYRRALEWIGKGRTEVIGGRTFPAELLEMPADQAMKGLERLILHIAENVRDEGDAQSLLLSLGIATAIAPLASDRNEDLLILRVAAGKLAQTGHAQRARDLAEQALTLARTDPGRARMAWFAYADVYARIGNIHEALIAMACTLAAHDEASWEQVWYESMLILRLFRDLEIIELARPLLAIAHDAQSHLGIEARYGSRLETVELQLMQIEYTRTPTPDREKLVALISRTSSNLREVLAVNDELAPAVNLLAGFLRIADRQGVAPDPVAEMLLETALKRLQPESRAFVEMVRALNPTIEQVVAFAGQIEPARYSEDVGYDVHNLVKLAERLLASAGSRSAEAALYATETLADRAIALPGHHAQDRRGGNLIRSATAPSEAIRELARDGLDVVTLGVAENRLTRVVGADGELCDPVVEPLAVFSEERFARWAQSYPFGYTDTNEVDLFYTTTEGLGVSELSDRAVVVATTDLQGFPVNLLRVGHQLAGREHRIAAAPSLSWLQAARRNPFRGDGRMIAWIPTALPDAGLPTLATIAERLSASFECHGVTLTGGSKPPEETSGADLFIVAAHGGVTEDNRYFRVVRDDVDLAIASSSLSNALSNIGTVILFVCSGGRVDKHPGASTTVGLVKRLLDNGCRAVIAPPWPLHASVPAYWLPAFLDAWDSGEPVIDACFLANIAVRSKLGDDPAKYLAMTVYGDPLASKTAAAMV